MIIHTRFRTKNGEPLWESSAVQGRKFYYNEGTIEFILRKYNQYGYVTNVMRFITPEVLVQAFRSIKPYPPNDEYDYSKIEVIKLSNIKDYVAIAPGIDGITKSDYGYYDREEQMPNTILKENINELYQKLVSKTYRHKPGRRIYIPKPNGKQRPLGIICLEDKIVERAIVDIIINPIYENVFKECSYAYRNQRNAKKAINNIMNEIENENMNYILEADIKGYFDNINHSKLIEMLKIVIKDKKVIEYIKDTLKSGYIDETDNKDTIHKTNRGTPQGGILSPILANVYLHYTLDDWIDTINTKGEKRIVRYADDFVILTQYKEDAELIHTLVKKRFNEYGLKLSKEKTNIIDFRPNSNECISFLGYELRRSNKEVIVDIDSKRLTNKLSTIESILMNINNDYHKYGNKGKTNLFYSDYIRWTNNILRGIYKYHSDHIYNINLYKLYIDTTNLVDRYFRDAPNMTTDKLDYYKSHIISPM